MKREASLRIEKKDAGEHKREMSNERIKWRGNKGRTGGMYARRGASVVRRARKKVIAQGV